MKRIVQFANDTRETKRSVEKRVKSNTDKWSKTSEQCINQLVYK